MMTLYFVMVRPGTSDRYTDSTWVELDAATARRDNLLEEFRRRGRSAKDVSTNEGWAVWISEGRIEDARLANKPKDGLAKGRAA